MPGERKRCTRATIATLACLSFVCVAPAQAPKTQDSRIASVALSFEQGGYGQATKDEISAAWAGQLSPILKKRFVKAQDPAQKAAIAAALVELGDKNDTYWNFVVEYARPALENDAPDWELTDSPGHPAEQSVEYRTWAKSHNIEPDSPADFASQGFSYRLQALASALDPRGIPLLRRGMQSPSHNTQVVAVAGLVAMNDRESIPLIIQACKKAPADMARRFAGYLNDFDDPTAKSAAELYMAQPPDPMEALRQSDEISIGSSLEALADKHSVDAIPLLEKRFQEAPDTYDATNQDSVLAFVDKSHIASVLVRLGDRNPIYWDYLASKAALSIESSAPSIMAFDASGKAIDDRSPQFTAWAKAHGKTVEVAAAEAMFVDPSGIAFLGMTRDPRALPLLRRALESPNLLIQGFAARELADRQDAESIPLLITACRTAPHEIASGLANDLARFDDPKARASAAEYIPQALVNTLYEEAHARRGAGQKPN